MASGPPAGYTDKSKVVVNRQLGQLRGALYRAGDLQACEQIRRARLPILKARLRRLGANSPWTMSRLQGHSAKCMLLLLLLMWGWLTTAFVAPAMPEMMQLQLRPQTCQRG